MILLINITFSSWKPAFHNRHIWTRFFSKQRGF